MIRQQGARPVQALPCPCGGGAYEDCCARFHRGAPAQTAEQLMRARYSAYVLHDNAFIVATWHPTTRPAMPPEDAPGTRWLGLEVRRHQQEGDQATVEFVARYRIDGRGQRLHEISRFVREAGWWWYLDGSFPKEEKQ
jgi:SEC-C motif-containing protein